MIQLVKNKIPGLNFSNQGSFDELTKLVEIAKLVIEEKSKECHPPYNECLEAIEKINKIGLNGKTQITFESIKSELIDILGKLLELLNQIDPTPSTELLLHGQKSTNFNNDLNYELLMVEQTNINYFKSRPGKLSDHTFDRLNSHTWSYEAGGTLHFGFNNDSDLPQNIRTQVTDAFEKIVKRALENIINTILHQNNGYKHL